MTHDEIQPGAYFAATGVALQNQFSPLEKERRLRSMFLGSELLQPAIEVFRYRQIHGHTEWYQGGTSPDHEQVLATPDQPERTGNEQPHKPSHSRRRAHQPRP